MNTVLETKDGIKQVLWELGFSPRLIGYKALCVAIPFYANANVQHITKELYPAIRNNFGYDKPTAIERPIRYAICDAWEHGDPEVWARYFPRVDQAPSNAIFIATLAEHIK